LKKINRNFAAELPAGQEGGDQERSEEEWKRVGSFLCVAFYILGGMKNH
jgi:hypothetical protein